MSIVIVIGRVECKQSESLAGFDGNSLYRVCALCRQKMPVSKWTLIKHSIPKTNINI